METDPISICRTQETQQDRQKLGQKCFFPSLKTKTKRKYSSTDLNILLRLNTYQPTILYRESVLARQKELPGWTKDDIRRRITSTLQSASLTDCNLTKDKLHALRRLKNDKDIVIRGKRTCYCCYGQ